MKDKKYFIDTNILIYSFDARYALKQKQAKQLIKTALEYNSGIISYQVIQEFLNVSSKKFQGPMTPQEQKIYLQKILLPLCEIFPTVLLYELALDIRERYRYSFYDSLIIASALDGNCKIIYSEDLQHEQNIYSIKIINPFK